MIDPDTITVVKLETIVRIVAHGVLYFDGEVVRVLTDPRCRISNRDCRGRVLM